MTERLLFPDRGFDAFLFDMDGTLLNSIAVAERVWGNWAIRHGLDPVAFLRTIHGVRAIETITALQLPGVDPLAEAVAINELELEDMEGIEAIAGVVSFLEALPADRWAIVTSAPRLLAERRLAAAGLVPPAVMVTSEDVSRGKPAPDCFLLAAERLGVRADRCVVFEDAPAGIAAAEAAGAAVVVVTTTHTHPLETPHPGIAHYERLAGRPRTEGLLDLWHHG